MKTLKAIAELAKDVLYEVSNFFYVNARYIMRMLSLIVILFSFFCGFSAANSDDDVVLIDLAVALVFAALISFVKGVANKYGKIDDTPVPAKRFTEVDDDGMVSVENDRLQELLLYVSEVEDYLKRKGKL